MNHNIQIIDDDEKLCIALKKFLKDFGFSVFYSLSGDDGVKQVRSKKPDLIISTHPFGSQMCSYLKRKGKISSKIATILTDFAPHSQWLVGSDFTDYFFVANEHD